MEELEIVNGKIAELRSKIESATLAELDELEKRMNDLEVEKSQIAKRKELIEKAKRCADEMSSNKEDIFKTIAIQEKTEERKKAKGADSEEYRNAFMNFVCRGTQIPKELRAYTTTSDVEAVIPTTILNEIVTDLKSYGNLFDKVRKLNVKGGVKIPILSLKPVATWITADKGASESNDQKLTANTSVSFNYYGLECKISQTLLAEVTTLDMFQEMFVPLATEAIVHALDLAIMNGDGDGEFLGITKDTRVPTANVVTLTSADFGSWSAWKKKVFAKMKKSYRNGEFIMAQGTFDGYIDGMTDDVGQPIARVNYGLGAGEQYRFGGKVVETVEDDIIADYESASTGDVVAVFVDLNDYVVNSNMQMTVTKWTDHDTNEVKNKVILIADGKLVDAKGVIIVKKGA